MKKPLPETGRRHLRTDLSHKKTNDMLYDILPKPARKDSTDTEYYIAPVSLQTIGEEELTQQIEAATTLTRSDVMGAIYALADNIASALQNGNKVKIGELGTFEVRLTTPKEDLQADDKVARHIRVRTVIFRPGRKLLRRLAGVSFTRTPHPRTFRSPVKGETLLERLRQYFASHEFLCRSDLQSMARCGRTQACAALRRLVADGYLMNATSPRQPHYRALPKLTGGAGE